MMSGVQVAWLGVGCALGIAHAAGIRSTAKRPSAITAFMGLVRLLAVGLALAAAAIFGGIVPAAAGWAIGFSCSVATVMMHRAEFGRGEVA